MTLDSFREIWLVKFAFNQTPGHSPAPSFVEAVEYRTGRCLELIPGDAPPYSLDADILFVTYDAPVALGCHLALGWPLPAHVLDLHAEFRCLRSGLETPGDFGVADALAHFGVEGNGTTALAKLLSAMLPEVSLGHALLRGRYTAAIARMEATGVPLDMESFARLRDGWERIQDTLIQRVDQQFRVYHGRKFNPRLLAAWVNKNGIPWPRLAPGRLDLRLKTFKDMAVAYPEVRPLKELRTSMSLLRSFQLAVGPDGRNRCPLRPFASKTGRNQPSTSSFIFGPASWLRGLIRPAKGMALAYVDFEQQEFGIAAALSGDPAMMEAYRSGDPYLTFAKQAGAIPADASKQSHRQVRDRFKQCALGVQYGMGAKSLAARLGIGLRDAQRLLRLHRQAYPTYWDWSNRVVQQARHDHKLTACYGWTLNVAADMSPRSLRNFPLQANGAEILRLACIVLTEAGVRICAPVHDALLIEARADDIAQAVTTCQQGMRRASELVLLGFPLRTEAKVVRYPDRYWDPRGQATWDLVFGLLDRESLARCA